MDKIAADIMMKARSRLLMSHGFFASILLRKPFVEDTTCGTMWTDGTKIGYSPDFVHELAGKAQTPKLVMGVLCHEVLHIVMFHSTRRGNREPQKWNIACDYAVNSLLAEDHITLPEGALIDSRYSGLPAEQIYAMLPLDEVGGGAGDEPGGEPGNGKPFKNFGEVRDFKGSSGIAPTEGEVKLLEAELKSEVAQAAKAEKARGKLPGFLARMVKELTAHKVDWKTALAEFVNNMARNDYSWHIPNPRYSRGGFMLPSLRSQEMPPLAIAIDTSGSITSDELTTFASELTGLMLTLPTEMHIIYCDSCVNGEVVHVTKDELPVKLEMRGGGGTDFRPPFERVQQEGIEPCCLIYFTDGECDCFPEEPEYPTLWIQKGSMNFQPPFGRVAKL